jgi:hypothetical protein
MEENSSNLAMRTTVLRCPRCNGDYLHHHAVTVYDRGGEGPGPDEASVTTVDFDGTRVGKVSGQSGNPSRYRNGMIIRFDCENCDALVRLDLYQHKGQTFLDIRED